MNARMERDCLRGTLLAALIGLAGCFGGGAPQGAVDPNCVLDDPDDEGEKSPGHPFNYAVFTTDIAPVLVASCSTAACHSSAAPPPQGQNGGFSVWAGAVDNECDRVQTFKSFRDKSILYAPETSPVYVSITAGTTATGIPHPATTTLGTIQQADADKILSFLQAANATCAAEGTCGGDPTGAIDFFDFNVFRTDVEPALDAASCGVSPACHLPPALAANSFPLIPNATSDADLRTNYESVKSRVALANLGDPKQSLFYINSVTPHAPAGNSTQIAPADRPKVESWIAAAKAAFDASGVPPTGGCANPALLDAQVFASDILPILRGEVNLNDRNNEGVVTGCNRVTCHGVARPGALELIPTDSIDRQLANFACFVNLASPSNSPVLTCPSFQPSCPKYPHPGGRIFDGAQDLNYQAILSFLFSTANTDNIPLDLAFFARNINPIFDTVQAVDNGAQAISCSETSVCHGVQIAGQAPPNGSNFGIIPNAGDNLNVLKINFVEAAAFTNFLRSDQSSLFLYPTGEIANELNPSATGLPHPGCNSQPGGGCFPADSVFATNILSFAEGLHPDPRTGDQLNWLIAGAFDGIEDIDDDTLIPEEFVTPRIFDPSLAQDLAGKWDATFADDAVLLDGELVVDVNAFLNGVAGVGRAAFAVAYIINTSQSIQEVKFILTSPNETRLYVAGSVAEGAPGQTVTLTAFLPPSRSADAQSATRVLIKLVEAVGQEELNFNLKMLDENNAPFGVNEILIKLQQEGGI